MKTPPVGDDAVFASMAAAYYALSSGLRTVLDGLRAWHKAVNDYDGHRRAMRRVRVEGVALG